MSLLSKNFCRQALIITTTIAAAAAIALPTAMRAQAGRGKTAGPLAADFSWLLSQKAQYAP